MFETIVSILGGGLTGLIGTFITGITNLKLKRLDLEDKKDQRAHEVGMVTAESNAMIAESQAQVQVTSAQVAGEVALAETKAFTASLESGKKSIFDPTFMDRLFGVEGWLSYVAVPAGILLSMLFGVVEFCKEIARPGITAYLLGISTWITIKAWDLLERMQGEGLTAAMAVGIVSDAVNVVLYLTVTAATWWFGDRQASKAMARNLKLGNR